MHDRDDAGAVLPALLPTLLPNLLPTLLPTLLLNLPPNVDTIGVIGKMRGRDDAAGSK